MSGSFANILTAIGSLGYSGNSAPVTIGSVTLTGTEVPSLLRVAGEQNLVVTTLPGGSRVIQAMGDNPARLTLAGMFVGPGAKARALLFQKMRTAGAPVQMSLSALSLTVVIAAYSYDLTQKGAIVPYELTVVVQPTTATSAASNTASLSALVGSDIGSAITSISSTVSDVSAIATSAIAQGQTIIGQVTPLATLVGLGGPLASAGTFLQGASVIAQTGTDFAAIPSSAASLITGLQSAGASLMTTISQAGSSLTGIQAAANPGDLFSGPGALFTAAGDSEVLSTAVQSGALVNRALGNAALATSAASLPVPTVHA